MSVEPAPGFELKSSHRDGLGLVKESLDLLGMRAETVKGNG
jgi:hypothetical protein